MLGTVCRKCLRDPQLKYAVSCVVDGLSFMHSRQMTHRDVKAENIGVDVNGVPKLVSGMLGSKCMNK